MNPHKRECATLLLIYFSGYWANFLCCFAGGHYSMSIIHDINFLGLCERHRDVEGVFCTSVMAFAVLHYWCSDSMAILHSCPCFNSSTTTCPLHLLFVLLFVSPWKSVISSIGGSRDPKFPSQSPWIFGCLITLPTALPCSSSSLLRQVLWRLPPHAQHSCFYPALMQHASSGSSSIKFPSRCVLTISSWYQISFQYSKQMSM